jgi:hypothetical protein
MGTVISHYQTDFDQTKAYFEKIVKATNVYKQNTGGNSA